jgi:hypothetical protein
MRNWVGSLGPRYLIRVGEETRVNRYRSVEFSIQVFALFSLLFYCPLAWADVFHMDSGLTSVEFVTVGNPGNAPDTRYGFPVGAVDHVYQIGKFEVTAGQYAEFLNAVAKVDPNGLYNTSMGDPGGHYGANNVRSGSSPNFSYSVPADCANRPVNFVNFWDAARFANWIQNGQPVGGQGPGTTEGGAYHDVGNQALLAVTLARDSSFPPRANGTRRPTTTRARAWRPVTSTTPRGQIRHRPMHCRIRGTMPTSTVIPAPGIMVTQSAVPTIAQM